MKYEKYPGPDMNISHTALMEFAHRLGPSFVYELRVPPIETLMAQQLARQLQASVVNNPFAPWLNVVADESYVDEWSLSANGRRIGCSLF